MSIITKRPYQVPLLLIMSVLFFLLPESAYAHIKWFVAFDISDPPTSLLKWLTKNYVLNLFILSVWVVLIASLVDSFWCKTHGKCTLLSDFFVHYNDIALNIARIGVGVFFVAIWLMGGVILTPELLSTEWFIPYFQLVIALSVLFRSTLIIAGLGILGLYGYAIYCYGLFHLLDYLTLVGLALYLILSVFNRLTVAAYRLPILYGSLVFSFLWSAIEKLAFPQWFYPFLQQNAFLTMGLEHDFFIASAAFVEFTLFFLLLMGSNGVIIAAFLSNIVIMSGNIYFGKIDAIGHFPVNIVLLIMMLNGPLTLKNIFFDHSCKPYLSAVIVSIMFVSTLSILLGLYYGLHWILYQ